MKLWKVLIIIAILISCTTVKTTTDSPMIPKKSPEHTGVDEGLQKYVNEYRMLAAKGHIYFTKPVTMGFANINHGNVIGLCTMSKKWREIDVDISFWKKATLTEKRSLVYHEMTHCFCGRDHDYGPMKSYEPGRAVRMLVDLIAFINPFDDKRPGFMKDGCPKSIMYPYILDDNCASTHREEYNLEMFERCEAW